MRRLLPVSLLGLLALGLLAWVAGYGYMRGWHLERLSHPEFQALLRPHDEVLRPPGRGPFPTVVQFHGCGGLHENQREWARAFRDAGFASLIVDSFAGRGLDAETVCGGRALLPWERAADVLVSLEHARRLSFVDPERIVLAGWSHGSITVIDALVMDPPRDWPPNLERDRPLDLAGVAGAIFFYPYCGFGSQARPWRARLPSLFLIAGADSLAAPGPCLALTEELAAAGHDVVVRVYDGVEHGFDHRAFADRPGSSWDPDATADARESIVALLARVASAS